MKHPTPWKLDSMSGDSDFEELDALVDANGECLIYFGEGIDDMEEVLETIVKCVNAHDALLEYPQHAYELAVSILDGDGGKTLAIEYLYGNEE